MTKGDKVRSATYGAEVKSLSINRSPSPSFNTPSTSPQSQPSSRRHSPFAPIGTNKTRRSPPPSRGSTPIGRRSVILQDPKGFAGDVHSDEEEGMEGRPPLLRPTDGRSQTPLLKEERGRPSYDVTNGSARPAFAVRRSTFRSRSPDMQNSSAVRKKYTYAAFFLLLSLISFVIQTETAIYIQKDLGWRKAYAML